MNHVFEFAQTVLETVSTLKGTKRTGRVRSISQRRSTISVFTEVSLT